MRRLLIGDIHAMLPAFEAVLDAAGNVDQIVFLGDVVGYGPHPAACVDLLMSLGAKSVIGNHDAEVVSEPKYDLDSASSPHQYWLRWTYEQLTSAHREFLAALPVSLQFEDPDLGPIHVVHSVGDGRLYHGMDDAAVAGTIADVPGRIVLCGHSHRAIDRTIGGRRLVCLPGVGQFRDGEYRLVHGTVSLRRLAATSSADPNQRGTTAPRQRTPPPPQPQSGAPPHPEFH